MNSLPTLNAKNLLLTLSFTLLLGGCGSDTEDTATSIENHLQRGNDYINQGQYKAALIEARNAVAKAPDSAKAYGLVANIYNDLGQAKLALEMLEKSNSQEADYLFTKAETLLALRKYSSAEKLLNEHQNTLTATDPLQLKLLEAQVSLGQNNKSKAKKQLEKIIQDHPESAEAFNLLSRLAFSNNQLQKTQELNDKALGLDPKHIEAQLIQAKLLYVQGNLEASEDALTNTLTNLPTTDIMTPERIATLRALSEILTQQGRSAEALIYNKILSEAMPGADAIEQDMNQAITHLKEGEIDRAKALLEAVLNKAPRHERASQLLGIINYQQGNFDTANNLFDNSVDPETAPQQAKNVFAMTQLKLNQPERVLDILSTDINTNNNAQTLSLYGIAALAANKTHEGEQALQKALSINPTQTRLHLLLARHYNQQQPPEHGKALKQLETAYQTTPEDPYIQASLLQHHIQTNKLKAAETFNNKLAKSHPNNENTLIITGNFYAAKGEFEKAKKQFNKALSLNNKNIQANNSLGKVLLQLKQLDNAKQHFKSFIKALPENINGYQGLLASYALSKQIDTGIKEVASYNEHLAPQLALANYYRSQKDFEKAYTHILAAKTINSNDARIESLYLATTLSEGITLLQNQQLEQARVAAMNGLNKQPNNSDLLRLLTYIEIDAKNFREAKKLISQIDNNYLVKLLNAKLAEAEGNTPLAIKELQSAWAEKPSNSIGQNLYQLLANTGDNNKLKAHINEWNVRFPTSMSAQLADGMSELMASRYKNAIAILQPIVDQQATPSPSLQNNLAWAYLQAGGLSQAEALAKAAYSASPTPEITDTYGWVLFKQGKQQQAKAILKEAIEKAPNNQEIQAHWQAVQ